MDGGEAERILVSEIGLSRTQARVFLFVTAEGMQTPGRAAAGLGIPEAEARRAAESLVAAGSFIEMPGGRFEATHPRFAAVNMYRRACERSGAKFGRNDAVDAVGASLEGAYDSARTK